MVNPGYFLSLPDSTQQSLVDKVSRRQRPDMNMLFLNVKVRRMHLVSDSLDEVYRIFSIDIVGRLSNGLDTDLSKIIK